MINNVLLIGVGGVGQVFVRKWDLLDPKPFSLHVASRRKSVCDDVRLQCKSSFNTYEVDADDVDSVVALIKTTQAELVVNLALPYQDLSIMDACLEAGAHYLDTANYEPPDTAKFEYHWQWAYRERFKQAGLMAVLGCGFDPGVTNIYSAYALKHHFDSIDTIDILDCNGGSHGHPFATNFNPEINIREITQRGRYYEDGQWKETDPLSVKIDFDFPGVGVKQAYLMYHEELESLAQNIPGIQRLRFWMTFSESYLTHLKVLENVGMTGIEPVIHNGVEIVPIQFLKTLLPDPRSLAANYKGKTSIGCVISGKKQGNEKTIFIYNVCDHHECFLEVGSQAISYTTAVPALLGSVLMAEGHWMLPGVFNVEELDPDHFMARIGKFGLPFKESAHVTLS
jgi:saccharopine dehydrogenase (NAD+, L-lysine-forming)